MKKLNNKIAKDTEPDFSKIVRKDRADLMEVCTRPDSELAAAVERRNGTAIRIGLFNGFDLATKTGLNRAIHMVRDHRPRRIVASPPCTAGTQIQNMNQKTEKQKEHLRQAKRRTKRIMENLEILFQIALKNPGTHIDFEQPVGNQNLKMESVARFREQTFENITEGCPWGLTSVRSGLPLQKRWLIMSTDLEMWRIKKNCSNRPGREDNHEHEKCLQADAGHSGHYPQRMCDTWAKIIMKDEDWDTIKKNFEEMKKSPMRRSRR